MTTKITSLTAANISSLNELFGDHLVTTRATTAEFIWEPAETLDELRKVMNKARMRYGNGSAVVRSMHAVVRKVTKLVK